MNEGQVADDLICGDERRSMATRATREGAPRPAEGAGIKDRIMHRPHKNQPRCRAGRRGERPHRGAGRRRAVFGAVKRLYGLARARYSTLARNPGDMIAFACPQPAPRRRPCPGLNRAQAPNPDAVEPSSGSVLDPTALQSSPAVEPKPFRRGLQTGEVASRQGEAFRDHTVGMT